MFEKQIKKLKWGDIALIKWSVLFFVFWLVTLLPGFRNWIISVNHWIWLVLFIVTAIIPLYAIFKK